MPCRKGGHLVRGNDVVRFWSKTAPGPGGCVDWVAACDRGGYGKFVTGPHAGQKHHRAHRWIYAQVVGSITPDVLLLHSCDRPQCVALQHLSPGTQKQNIADAIAKRRAIIGEASGVAVLTEIQVVEIRRRWDRGDRATDIAREMKLPIAAVRQAARRITWRHVP